MGLTITVKAHFHIAEAKKAQAYKEAMTIVGDLPFLNDPQSLEDILADFDYPAINDNDGNIIDLDFAGENFGSEHCLFQAIAPYVSDGSYLEYHGDDDSVWRWVFVGGELLYIKPKIAWEMPETVDDSENQTRKVTIIGSYNEVELLPTVFIFTVKNSVEREDIINLFHAGLKIAELQDADSRGMYAADYVCKQCNATVRFLEPDQEIGIG